MLAQQYLQRHRERLDIDDVLRAQRAAEESLAALPLGNLPADLELASIDARLDAAPLSVDALAITKHVEFYDAGDPAMYAREASLDMEIGDYAAARARLDAVPAKARDDEWDVVESRYRELTGQLAAARRLLAVTSAYQNANFDAPAQQRAWYFFRQGEMAFEAGDNDTALADERQAVAIFPNDADALRTLARIACSLHDWRQCLTDAIASSNIVPYPETLGYEADAQRAWATRRLPRRRPTRSMPSASSATASTSRTGCWRSITPTITSIRPTPTRSLSTNWPHATTSSPRIRWPGPRQWTIAGPKRACISPRPSATPRKTR